MLNFLNMLLILKLLLSVTISGTLDTFSYEDVSDFDHLISNPTYQEIFLAKLKDIASSGFTIEEFQKAMVLLCLIRFVIYSVKYNIITSFKICAIGLFSCILWGIALNDCVGIYYPMLRFNPLLTNILREETAFRQAAEARAYDRISAQMFREMADDVYNFQWIRPIFNLVPQKFHTITKS